MIRHTRFWTVAVAALAVVALPWLVPSLRAHSPAGPLGDAQAAPPGPPQNFSSLVSGNTVALQWLSPLTGGEPSAYLLEAALSPGGTIIGQLLIGATSTVIPGVPDGAYYLTVRAVNAAGAGEPSAEIIIVVPQSGGGGECTSPPNPPSISVLQPDAAFRVTINWRPPVGGCPATSYILQAGSKPGLIDIAVINAGAQTWVTGTAPPGEYYLRVIAVNAYGGSQPSPEVRYGVCEQPWDYGC